MKGMPRWARRVIQKRRLEKEKEKEKQTLPIPESISDIIDRHIEDELLVRKYISILERQDEERDTKVRYILFWMLSLGIAYTVGLHSR